jgi:hypothetical protein
MKWPILAGSVLFAGPLFADPGVAPSPTLDAPGATAQVAAPPAAGSVDPFKDPLIQQVQARHDKAVKGDAKEAKALTSDLEKWTHDQPQNHLLQAYLGSVYTLDSRDAWPGPGKLRYLRDGGRLMDQAVAAAPDNPAVRFIRAINYFELPFIFGTHQTARNDFEILLRQVEGIEQTSFALDIATQQAICYYAGLSFRQIAQGPQARDAWRHGIALNPDSDLGRRMNIEMLTAK